MIRENDTDTEPSVLAALRALTPQRPASFAEALWVAEQQAARLLNRSGVRHWPVPETTLLDLPRIQVEQRFDLPTSGCSFWDTGRRTWVIQVNGTEPVTRQRFTLLHEYKHIVDHSRVEMLYGTGIEAHLHAEQAADFFAGCALLPRPLLKRAWGDGIQQVHKIAAAFEVSPQAVVVRLAQTGLARSAQWCGRTTSAWRTPPRRAGDRQRRSHPTSLDSAGAST